MSWRLPLRPPPVRAPNNPNYHCPPHPPPQIYNLNIKPHGASCLPTYTDPPFPGCSTGLHKHSIGQQRVIRIESSPPNGVPSLGTPAHWPPTTTTRTMLQDNTKNGTRTKKQRPTERATSYTIRNGWNNVTGSSNVVENLPTSSSHDPDPPLPPSPPVAVPERNLL